MSLAARATGASPTSRAWGDAADRGCSSVTPPRQKLTGVGGACSSELRCWSFWDELADPPPLRSPQEDATSASGSSRATVRYSPQLLITTRTSGATDTSTSDSDLLVRVRPRKCTALSADCASPPKNSRGLPSLTPGACTVILA